MQHRTLHHARSLRHEPVAEVGSTVTKPFHYPPDLVDRRKSLEGEGRQVAGAPAGQQPAGALS